MGTQNFSTTAPSRKFRVLQVYKIATGALGGPIVFGALEPYWPYGPRLGFDPYSFLRPAYGHYALWLEYFDAFFAVAAEHVQEQEQEPLSPYDTKRIMEVPKTKW